MLYLRYEFRILIFCILFSLIIMCISSYFSSDYAYAMYSMHRIILMPGIREERSYIMDASYTKIPSRIDPNVTLKLFHGHFATPHSHINCYIDITTMKTRCSEAHGVATLLASHYSVATPVDTIVCLDGTEVIGTYLAEELTRTGVLSYNAHKTIYVVPPEYTPTGQIIFRDNMQMAIRRKHVLILCGSITTGGSLATAVECLKYYDAEISGACAIFSMVNKVAGMPVYAAFTSSDIPDYKSYTHHECPLCRQGAAVDALVNSFGISIL